MKVLSNKDAVRWCQEHNVGLTDHDLPDLSEADSKFEIPADAQKRVCLISKTMAAFENEPLLLVWLDDWSVWASGQRMHVFDRFRMSYGETRPLIEAPAHLFDQTEHEDAISFVTLAVLFLWDCYVVTPKLGKLLHLSHDEWGETRGISIREQVEWLTPLS